MNSLETILDTWEEDSAINSTEPGKELLNIPKLHSKYLKALIKTKLKLKQVRNEYAEIRKTRWNYYNGNYNTDKDKLDEIGYHPLNLF